MRVAPKRLPDQARQVNRAMTLTTEASPFGCCNFFDLCSDDDIMALHYQGALGLLDWLGFTPVEECYRSVNFIEYVRPKYVEGSPSVGYISNPCADPNGVEYGMTKLTVEDFGLVGRQGPTRKVLAPTRYCRNEPRFRLSGQQITDEREWDLAMTMDTILGDMRELVVTGNAGTPGQFDGLQRWVRNDYSSSMLNSIVIDWNGNAMAGGAGITWNGQAVGSTFSFMDVLMEALSQIRYRISWSNMLRNQQFNVGDIVLALPYSAVKCVLDSFTCWRVCEGSQYNESVLQSLEARTFRNSLLGGMFGFGKIEIDGIEIPLLVHDEGLINGPTLNDIYLLTGSIGAVRLFEGEILDAGRVVQEMMNAGDFFTTDSGRVLGQVAFENLCRTLKLWMAPRLFNRAPWAQIRFQDVKCLHAGPVISSDPNETSFYPLTSFAPAVCP